MTIGIQRTNDRVACRHDVKASRAGDDHSFSRVLEAGHMVGISKWFRHMSCAPFASCMRSAAAPILARSHVKYVSGVLHESRITIRPDPRSGLVILGMTSVG